VISGKTIICFASGWDYHPTSKHHIMRKLSAYDNHVIWINWHASRRPNIGLSDLRSIASKLLQIRKGPKKATDNLTVVTPCQLPLPGLNLARRSNAAMVRRTVQKIMTDLPPRPVQLWSFAPDVVEMVGGFNEELVLYYCVDAFGEFPGYDREMIEKKERELMKKSDVVITTSPPLYEDKRRWHPNVHFVQHGVDHAHLSQAVNKDLPMPKALQKLPRPIWGFIGVIGEWVDLQLVAGVAKQRPDVSIVMIGPENQSRGACTGLSNIHWLGPKDHGSLPNYLHYFDVGLIPFKQVPLTYNANPIKLYEYLAAGVPVVSTSLPAVESLEDAVWIADDAEKTALCCDAAMQCNHQADRQRRSKLMLAESWEARLEQLSGIVSSDRHCNQENEITEDTMIPPADNAETESVLVGETGAG